MMLIKKEYIKSERTRMLIVVDKCNVLLADATNIKRPVRISNGAFYIYI